jgi:membrane associated rhomboid family serine protease
MSNTLPLLVLLLLLAGSRARSWAIVAGVSVLGGSLLWVFGRPAIHIGASGLIFGLTTFLIASGLFERRLIPLLVSACVGFLYGGALVSGVAPGFRSEVSWDGHLCGAVAGIVAAYASVPRGRGDVRAGGPSASRIEKPPS